MPHGAESSPVRLSGAPQSLGPCCLPTACATRTLPACMNTFMQDLQNNPMVILLSYLFCVVRHFGQKLVSQYASR